MDGKEDSTTEKFPSLIFLSARLVYYLNLNCMYNLEKTVVDNYNCECYHFSCCKKINGIRDYCDLCSLLVKHPPYENEKNYRIKHLIEKHLSLINDFKEYKHVKIHVGDYYSKNINLAMELTRNGLFIVMFLRVCISTNKHFFSLILLLLFVNIVYYLLF